MVALMSIGTWELIIIAIVAAMVVCVWLKDHRKYLTRDLRPAPHHPAKKTSAH